MYDARQPWTSVPGCYGWRITAYHFNDDRYKVWHKSIIGHHHGHSRYVQSFDDVPYINFAEFTFKPHFMYHTPKKDEKNGEKSMYADAPTNQFNETKIFIT